MADVGQPYVPYVPGPGGPGYTVTPTPSVPRPPSSPPPPVYSSTNESANPSYSAAGVVVGLAAYKKKIADKRAISVAKKLFKKGAMRQGFKTLGKRFARRLPYVGLPIALYSYLPASVQRRIEAFGKQMGNDYVAGYKYYGGVLPMRKARLAPHGVSASSKYLKQLQQSLPKSQPQVAPRVSPKPSLGRPAGLASPALRRKFATKPIAKPKFSAPPNVRTILTPGTPTVPIPAAPPKAPPVLKSPRAAPSIPPWLSPLLTAATLREPRVVKTPLTPNNPVSVASPFISSPPGLGFAQGLASNPVTQKCACKRRKGKKRGCGSGYFKVSANGRETYKYWSKSKCQPSR